MKQTWKVISIGLITALTVTACSTGGGARGTNNDYRAVPQSNPRAAKSMTPNSSNNKQNQKRSYGMMRSQTNQTNSESVILPYENIDNEQYISVDKLVEVMQFENDQVDEESYRALGDKDVILRLKAGTVNAEKEGDPVQLPAAPKQVNGKLMIPVAAILDLFSNELMMEQSPNGLVIYPNADALYGVINESDTGPVDESLDFADDPNDPFKDEDVEGAFTRLLEAEPGLLEQLAAEPEAEAVLKNININALISTSKKYLGVRYVFGAKPGQTRSFDCSSYTQHVFKQYGINLPRTARKQASVGTTVSRKNLRKGDLVFFYVPGRFRSNKVIGHVGIYLGNGNMINANTAPKNGVQITSMNKPFWKKTYITAKRVAY